MVVRILGTYKGHRLPTRFMMYCLEQGTPHVLHVQWVQTCHGNLNDLVIECVGVCCVIQKAALRVRVVYIFSGSLFFSSDALTLLEATQQNSNFRAVLRRKAKKAGKRREALDLVGSASGYC
jgi:hypothetical protein